MVYSKIVNPINGKKVNVNSKIGKSILRKYLSVLRGGTAASKTESPPRPIRSTPCNVNKMFMQSVGICFQDAALNALFSADIISDIAMKFFFTFYEKDGKLYPSRVNTFDPVSDGEKNYSHAMYILLNIVAKNIRNNIKLHSESLRDGDDALAQPSHGSFATALESRIASMKQIRSYPKDGEGLYIKYQRIFIRLSIASYALSQYLGRWHGTTFAAESQPRRLLHHHHHPKTATSWGGWSNFVVQGLLDIKVAGTILSRYITQDEHCYLSARGATPIVDGYFSVGGNPLSFIISTRPKTGEETGHALNIYLCNDQWFLFDNNYQVHMKGARRVTDFLELIPDDFIIHKGDGYKVKLDIINQMLRAVTHNAYGNVFSISALYATEEGREYMTGAIEINPGSIDYKFYNFIKGLGTSDNIESFVRLIYGNASIFVAMERLFPHETFAIKGDGRLLDTDTQIYLDDPRTTNFPFNHLDPDGSIKTTIQEEEEEEEEMKEDEEAQMAAGKAEHERKIAATTKSDSCGNPFYCDDDLDAIGYNGFTLDEEVCAPADKQFGYGNKADCSSYCREPVCGVDDDWDDDDWDDDDVEEEESDDW